MFADALGSSEDANLEHLGDLMLALERSGSSLQQLASQDPHQSLQPWLKLADQLIRAASAIVADPELPVPKRLAAATLLSRSQRHRVAGVTALAQWLQPQVDAEIQTKVIATLAQSAAAEIPEVLAEAWPRLSPKLQAQAVDAWLSRTAWTEDLLHRLEEREIPRGSLDLTQQARLKQHPSPRISERARSLLDVRSDATPKQIVKQYREALELEGNAGRGKLIYTQACAKCHRRGDQGQDIGPNLATVIHHPPEKLLINILDPNADIQPGYQAYICLLQSGEVLSGLLAGETANSLTIRQANGGVRIVARGEIEELRNLNTSLMPEGLEAAISRQDLADLIAYLREPLATAGTQREEP